MTPHSYLLDENVHPGLRQGLYAEWPNIVIQVVGDLGTPPKGTPDSEIPLWCEANGFSLVTNNRASMPVHLAEHLATGHHLAGLLVLSPTMSFGAAIEELALIWAASGGDEFADQLTFLPVSTR